MSDQSSYTLTLKKKEPAFLNTFTAFTSLSFLQWTCLKGYSLVWLPNPTK